jgi:hypothetical protein
MPQQPTVPRPAAERATTEPEQTAPAKGMDLTVNKVLAGAGAAVTSAVLGSYFGATGTVAGAALGSVASTVATTLYQHSLDRTRDTLVARVRLSRGRGTDLSDAPTVQLTVPQPRVSPDSPDEATTQLRVSPDSPDEATTQLRVSPDSPDEATTQLRVEPALRMPRRIWLWVGATVLVFAIGLLVVTGLEWAKGSSLTTGQPGTSVGRVLTPPSDRQEDSDRNTRESDSERPTQSAEPTEEPTATAEPTTSAEPTAEATPTDDADASAEPTAPARENERGTTATPRPTPENPIPDRPENN